MSIYAIGDLHLSSDNSKSMDKFGWIDHDKKIFQNWQERVNEDDLVIVAGDISWALKYEDSLADLEQIKNMPGKKVFIKGNHDFWWTSISKINSFDKDMTFLQNTIYEYGDYVICGSRGWLCPNEIKFDSQDEKLYNRETMRLKAVLDMAKKTEKEIILVLHYPPTNDKKENSNFTDIIKQYNIKTVIYGHLHGKDSFDASLKGTIENTTYHLVSCDYLDFKLKKIF